jgi:hypothetical protein
MLSRSADIPCTRAEETDGGLSLSASQCSEGGAARASTRIVRRG